MRQAARLCTSRLLAALPPSAGRGGALSALPAAACACMALEQPAAGCRAAAWGRSAWPPAAGSCRALSTAAPAETGPLRQFRLAQTGEGIKECELVQWFVGEGDSVEEFGRVCEVQSDKATFEITSPYAGVVRRLHHKPGDVVQVGEVLADIHLEEGGDLELHSPSLETSGSLSGAAAAQQQQQHGEDEHAPGTARRQELHPATSGSIGEDEVADRVLTSPAVRRLAKDYGISLAKVAGTGPGGRVTKGDVLAYLDSLSAAGPGTIGEDVTHGVPTTEEATVAGIPKEHPHVALATPQQPEPAAAAAAAEPTVIHLRGYRKAMVKSMTAAAAIPHFHYCDEIQGGEMAASAGLVAPSSHSIPSASWSTHTEQHSLGQPVALLCHSRTTTRFAAALAIRDFPLVNASLGQDQASVLQHRRVNLGVAMATPHGLAVPNIKDVQDKSILELAAELGRLQAAAAANKLTQADTSGGTFTLSNIGTIGGTYATPLVNPPEVAIMAVGRVQRVPRFVGDTNTVAPASIMNISLGADHRVVDGATLAGFARAWAGYVESPGRLLLHLR
ncbi:hypothetical protein ABPG75_008519 [Micractinium tetrahymenae]